MLQKKKKEKKVVEMRRHWSRFTPKSQFTQHNSCYTCNLALHKPLWRTQSSFLFFFLDGGTKPLHPLSLYCAFGNLHSFWTQYIEGNLSFQSQTAVYWISGTATSSCTTLSSTIGKVNNSISQTLVLSRPYFSFSLFSCPFLHPCSFINPTLHYLSLTHTSSFFSESCSIPKLCKGATTSPQSFPVIWQKVFLLVLLDWFFAHALLGTSLSLSWWSLMCSS